MAYQFVMEYLILKFDSFRLVSLSYGVSNFKGYLMPKNSNYTTQPIPERDKRGSCFSKGYQSKSEHDSITRVWTHSLTSRMHSSKLATMPWGVLISFISKCFNYNYNDIFNVRLQFLKLPIFFTCLWSFVCTWFQVFPCDTNNLHTVVWFQVFLFMQIILLLQVIISI